MTKLQLRYIAKWVELLKSGKFKQDQRVGFIKNGKGCLGAILVRAMLLEEGYKTNFYENIEKLRTDNWNIITVLPKKVTNNFLYDENKGAWSFNKMADYITKKYL